MLAAPTFEQQDRRQHQRFKVKQNTLALSTSTFGEIINISAGGLRLKCLLHSDEPFATAFDIGLLANEGDYYLDNLPCKVVSIKDSSPLQASWSTFIREAGIMFVNLTGDQQAKLSLFLKQNTSTEA